MDALERLPPDGTMVLLSAATVSIIDHTLYSYGSSPTVTERMADERPYDPRPYDSRYARGYDEPRSRRPRYDDDYRGGGGGGGGRDYDRYRDYDRGYDRGGGGGGYERSSRGYDDRRY